MSDNIPENILQEEKKVMDSLVEAWNAFIELHVQHPDDVHEFRLSLHRLQHLVMIRQSRRLNPSVYHMEA